MALDGIVINKLTNEIKEKVLGKKINKIIEISKDTFLFDFRDLSLLISSNASFPRFYLTCDSFEEFSNNNSNFLQCLRKYISSGIILDVNEIGLDRIIKFTISSLNIFKEKVTLYLYLEIMGKYSNIILTNDKNEIIDSAKHVSSFISSKREILPKKTYERIIEENKFEILDILKDCASSNDIENKKLEYYYSKITPFLDSSLSFENFFSNHFYGISKILANSFTKYYIASNMDSLDSLDNSNSNSNSLLNSSSITIDAFKSFLIYIKNILISNDNENYKIYFDVNNTPIDFHVSYITSYCDYSFSSYDNISDMLNDFYRKKALSNNVKSINSNLKILVNNLLQKDLKKKLIYQNNINDCSDLEKYKEYGDLILGNMYNIKKGDKVATVINYFDSSSQNITIKLDENLSPSDNANKYYKKYNKLKNTLKNSTILLKELDEEIIYLESVISYLNNALSKNDVELIKSELIESGYLKKSILNNLKNKNNKQNNNNKSKNKIIYTKFISSDGYEIYVGKNNLQNDEITFKVAKENDMWLHAKDIPGSHVIIKLNGTPENNIPEKTLLEALNLAAYYSNGREFSKVPIDYTLRKYVKKPNGSKPGFVIFLNNKTSYITIDKNILNKFDIKI